MKPSSFHLLSLLAETTVLLSSLNFQIQISKLAGESNWLNLSLTLTQGAWGLDGGKEGGLVRVWKGARREAKFFALCSKLLLQVFTLYVLPFTSDSAKQVWKTDRSPDRIVAFFFFSDCNTLIEQNGHWPLNFYQKIKQNKETTTPPKLLPNITIFPLNYINIVTTVHYIDFMPYSPLVSLTL